ncbi:nucleotidyltransferase [Labilibacter sediminis]|nr:nucleotidyltransferase [Labilibacter sediminis]
MKKTTLLVLAAGMGSRYGGLKQLDPIGPNGETIIDYSIYDAIRSGFQKIVFVIRESFKDEFIELFNKKTKGLIEVEYVTQEINKVPSQLGYNLDREKPWGTGHAILMAKDCIDGPFAVINADDFYGQEAFDAMATYLKNNITEKENCMVGYQLKNTISENGHVSRGVCEIGNNSQLVSVVERTKIGKKDDGIYYEDNSEWLPLDTDSIVSMNFWGFTSNLFEELEKQFADFIKEKGQELKSEFFIPTVVESLMQKNISEFKVLKSTAKWFGVTYKEDKEMAVSAINELISKGTYPANLWNNN